MCQRLIRGSRCNKDGISDDSFHIFLLQIVPMIDDNLIVSDRAPSVARLKEDFPEKGFPERKKRKKKRKKKEERKKKKKRGEKKKS